MEDYKDTTNINMIIDQIKIESVASREIYIWDEIDENCEFMVLGFLLSAVAHL